MHTIEGRISQVFLSGHNDYEEFAIDGPGDRTYWTRVTSGEAGGSAERIAKAALYEVGRAVTLKYVVQQFRKQIPGLPFSKCVLEIWVGDHLNTAQTGAV